MESFRDLLGQWPSMEDLAKDVGAPVSRVVKWRTRDRVPSEYWRVLLDAASKRDIQVTPELLVELSDKQREQPAA